MLSYTNQTYQTRSIVSYYTLYSIYALLLSVRFHISGLITGNLLENSPKGKILLLVKSDFKCVFDIQRNISNQIHIMSCYL